MGRGPGRPGQEPAGVQHTLDEIFQALPFPVLGIESDNGTEFINQTLYDFCQERGIRFTRGRPYKKDDNAHIEQKNWTHVRRLVGWERYDSPAALAALNALYEGEWRTMMNVFQPSVKLQAKLRVGSRLRRRYGTPRTPLARLQRWGGVAPRLWRSSSDWRRPVIPLRSPWPLIGRRISSML